MANVGGVHNSTGFPKPRHGPEYSRTANIQHISPVRMWIKSRESVSICCVSELNARGEL